MSPGRQRLTLAIPAASMAWTITRQEIFSEAPRLVRAQQPELQNGVSAEFFYRFTCEYCFSHYVAAIYLALTRFKLLMPRWRGHLTAGVALV